MHYKKIIDHLGNEFPSKKAMCEHWNIDFTTFYSRIKSGLSLKDGLEKPILIKTKGIIVKDHLGNEFPNEREMCEYWKIDYSCYKSRKKRGWNMKERLEGRKKIVGKTSIDHLGNEFPSIQEMCKFWKITRYKLQYRLACNWSLKDALETKDEETRYMDIYAYAKNIKYIVDFIDRSTGYLYKVTEARDGSRIKVYYNGKFIGYAKRAGE